MEFCLCRANGFKKTDLSFTFVEKIFCNKFATQKEADLCMEHNGPEFTSRPNQFIEHKVFLLKRKLVVVLQWNIMQRTRN